jgi:hypothetical protein
MIFNWQKDMGGWEFLEVGKYTVHVAPLGKVWEWEVSDSIYINICAGSEDTKEEAKERAEIELRELINEV